MKEILRDISFRYFEREQLIMDAQQVLLELSEFLQQYYDGSFSRMVCDYIRSSGMTPQEVEELLETIKQKTEQ